MKYIKSRIIYFLAIYIMLSLVILAISFIFFNKEKSLYLNNLKKLEKYEILLQEKVIKVDIDDVISDVLIYSNISTFLDSLENKDDIKKKEKLRVDFRNLFRFKKKYLQIRYLDLNGIENFRVDFNNLDKKEYTKKLQDKLNRYYLKESIILKKNEIYISPFDLNIEHGQIEKPFKPIIRIATVVWDRNNIKRGVFILNYLGAHLINEIKRLSKLSKSKFILLNKDSYSFFGMGEGKDWGFMFNDRKDYKFSNIYTKEWDIIKKSDYSQFMTRNGLFTSRKIYLQKANRYWILISYISSDKILDDKIIKDLIFVISFFFIANIILSLLISTLIIKRKIHLEQLSYSANYDLLTKLPNRALFYDRLEQAYQDSIRYKNKFALLFIDLDGFKLVNDTHGHEVGDTVLKEVAKKLTSIVRTSDTAARLGGDEFTLILKNIDNKEDICNLSNKIILELSKDIEVGSKFIKVGASIGVCIFDDTKKLSIDDIIQKADNAMYVAKKSGKNQCYFSKE